MKGNFKIIFIGLIFFGLPFFVFADTLNQTVVFTIDSSYDLQKRQEISATLQKNTNQIYYYIDDNWWSGLNVGEKTKISGELNILSDEFENKIYPTLTSSYGSEWKSGIDSDDKITILFHPMIDGAGGYFNSGDEYPKVQNPKSNQREMIYLNSQYIGDPLEKSFLAHEFTHLITFNQKDKKQGVTEDVWLNEARAEYAPTLLGYDDVFSGSNLQKRVNIFLENPSDSLLEWQNQKFDYGVANLFIHYLVDHYGLNILSSSLKYSSIGVASINEALARNGFYGEDFSSIFTNWTVAVLVNNCSIGEKYCYLNPNLKNLRIAPQVNFLPSIGESVFRFSNAIFNWSGNWYKIIGGKGTLIINLTGDSKTNFKVPYVICDNQYGCQVQFMSLDKDQKGKITIPEFNKKYISLTFIPSVQGKISGFNDFEPNYFFSWEASTVEKTEDQKNTELINQLLAQIAILQKQITQIKLQIAQSGGNVPVVLSCSKLMNNLYVGLRNNQEVTCLQEFLKKQGMEIYPEGLITGNFFLATQAAVVRFQEKYASEILTPLGFQKGTGYVGSLTRMKINQFLGK